MKTKLLSLFITFVVVSPVLPADNLSDTLQRGLFEEEANHDLAAAIRAYQAITNRFEDQRKLAATAVFRLGECYRKLGRTNEANTQYQRVLREFSDQPQLVQLSREYLGPAAASSATATASIPGALPPIVTDGQTYYPATEEERNSLLLIIATAKNSPDLVNGEDSGLRPLYRAAQRDQMAVAQYLVTHGAGVNSRTGNGLTPLTVAASTGHRSMAQLLIDHGADVNARNATGATPLFFAVSHDFQQTARLLLSRGAEVNLVGSSSAGTPADNFGTTCPLFLAARHRDLEMVRLLLEHKADVNLKSEEGRTPLFAPIIYIGGESAPAPDQLMIVKLLLERGANVNARDNHGATPLDGCGSPVLAKMLLEHGADPNAIRADGTPLIISALFPNSNSSQVALDLVRLLVEHGAEVNQTNRAGQTALALAISQGRKDVAAFLLQHGADVSAKDITGHTALWAAVATMNLDLARLLLEHGADPNQPLPMSKNENEPLLHLAIAESYMTKKDVPGRNRWDSADILRLVGLLLEFKAEVNSKNANGQTALFRAVGYGLTDVAALLLQHHADVNARDNDGETPLLLAMATEISDLADLLIKHGADVNVRNPLLGWTAIFYAILRGDKAMVAQLTAAGADLKLAAPPYRVMPGDRGPLGLTSLEFAVALVAGQIPGHSISDKQLAMNEIIDYLRKHGGVERPLAARGGSVSFNGPGVKSSQMALEPGKVTTLSEALKKVGVTQEADLHHVSLNRGIKVLVPGQLTEASQAWILDVNEIEKDRRSEDPPLQDGDEVSVPKMPVSYE